MARIRSIKPEFFKHEDLSELPAMVRLLFIGLWTQSDRAGRLEDRPKRIKVEVFPYEDFDVEEGLSLLKARGFIERYQGKLELLEDEKLGKSSAKAQKLELSEQQKLEESSSDEIKLIQIINFSKHQQPNVKEKESFFSAPCKHRADTPVLSVLRGNVEGKGKGNGIPAAVAAGDDSGDKPQKKITPHWKQIKDTWIDFYKKNFNGVEPNFNGGAASALKFIAESLQRTASKSPATALNEWTEEYAVRNFTHFLTLAYADKWRKQNFRLPVLSGHFDSIIQKIPYDESNSKTGRTEAANEDLRGKLAEHFARRASESRPNTG